MSTSIQSALEEYSVKGDEISEETKNVLKSALKGMTERLDNREKITQKDLELLTEFVYICGKDFNTTLRYKIEVLKRKTAKLQQMLDTLNKDKKE